MIFRAQIQHQQPINLVTFNNRGVGMRNTILHEKYQRHNSKPLFFYELSPRSTTNDHIWLCRATVKEIQCFYFIVLFLMAIHTICQSFRLLSPQNQKVAFFRFQKSAFFWNIKETGPYVIFRKVFQKNSYYHGHDSKSLQ